MRLLQAPIFLLLIAWLVQSLGVLPRGLRARLLPHVAAKSFGHPVSLPLPVVLPRRRSILPSS